MFYENSLDIGSLQGKKRKYEYDGILFEEKSLFLSYVQLGLSMSL